MIEKVRLFFSRLLSLSYQESRGFTNLLIICFLALSIMMAIWLFTSRERPASAEDIRRLDSLSNLLISRIDSNPAIEPFPFNPNTISPDSLILLGIPANVATNLVRYRQQGGVFRIRQDITKIYGFSDELYNHLAAFVELPESLEQPAGKILTRLDLNNISAEKLAGISSISAPLARRIINYREALGGFISLGQLQEVYGMDTSQVLVLASSLFVNNHFSPRKIKINQANESRLRSHPYISDRLAADIVRFREVNGAISSKTVLAGFRSVEEKNFEKLILYLDFAD